MTTADTSIQTAKKATRLPRFSLPRNLPDAIRNMKAVETQVQS